MDMQSSTHFIYPNYYFAPNQVVYPVGSYLQHQNVVFDPYCLPMQPYPCAPTQQYGGGGGVLPQQGFDNVQALFQKMSLSANNNNNNNVCEQLPDWLYDDNGNINVDLSEIVSKELFFACLKDKIGSRFIQDNFADVSVELKYQIYDVLFQPIVFNDIAIDRYGNFVLQRIIESLVEEYRRDVIELVAAQCVRLSFDRFSCRVVQKVLDVFPTEELTSILNGFKGSIVPMSLDQSANHVLQKIIKLFSDKELYFIGVELTQNMDQAICNKFGCRVIQFLLEKLCDNLKENYPVQGDKELLRIMLDKIVSQPRYCQDEFANYVVQYILTHSCLKSYAQLIVDRCVRRNMVIYSTEKFASHVVEKALNVVEPHTLDEMVQELFKKPYKRNGKLSIDKLLFDQYGNYVVQRLLTMAIEIRHGKRRGSTSWFNMLKETITENASALLRYSSGKKIIETLSCELGEPIV